MNKQELLNQIKEWGKAQQHQKIADAIEALPESERDYLFTCILAREYNMLHRYEEAKELLDTVRKEGKNDPNWFFHYGYTFYSMKRYAEAKGAFQQVLKMVPKHPNVMILLNNCNMHLEKQALAKAFGDGSHLDEEKTIDFILKYYLHDCFEVNDRVEDDHIVIPSWNISIYPEITDLQADAVAVTFNIECPDWDRDIVEVSAAKGPNPAAALTIACNTFMMSLIHTFTLAAKKVNAVRMETEFAGKKHGWNVYRGNLLAGGEAQKVQNFNLYWDALKDQLAKRIGNQKMAYVKIFAMKNGDQIKGECRINDVRIESLSHIVAELVKTWDCDGYGIHRQFFIFQQDAETLEPYAYDAEMLEAYTMDAIRLFGAVKSREDALALPNKISELCGGDATLARELQLYIPMVAAEHAFRKLAYPETLTFEFQGGRKETVFRSQMAAFHPIQHALHWAMQYKVFGEETERLYQTLVSASPLFQFVQKGMKEGNPVKDGMGVNLTIGVSDDFEIR